LKVNKKLGEENKVDYIERKTDIIVRIFNKLFVHYVSITKGFYE